jgi:hypothetical protein
VAFRYLPAEDAVAGNDSLPDGELVGSTLAGDPEAYKQLVTRYQGHVYALAYSLVGNWSDAQDLAQETFIRAYSNLDKLREPGRFAPWLRRGTSFERRCDLRLRSPGAAKPLRTLWPGRPPMMHGPTPFCVMKTFPPGIWLC